MAQRHVIDRAYRWSLAGLAGLVALVAATWLYEARGQPAAATLRLPLGGGRELHVNIWKPGFGYSPTDLNRGALLDFRGPLNVVVWYRAPGSVRVARLLAFRVLLWPLLLPTALLALVALMLGIVRHKLPRT